jgi:putative peptidoglycan lipid II flippase
MICTASSRLFGYVKQALISAYFGGAGPADAINAVFNIPNNLRKLFAEGALSSAFIPILSSTIVEDPSGLSSRKLVRNLFALLVIALVPPVGLSLAFPRLFIQILLPFSDPDKIPLASGLFRWMFNYILLVSLGALIMAVLNSHGRFAVPALSPLLFSFAIILSIVFLGKRLGPTSMGIGVLVGGMAQLVFQMPAFRRRGYDFRLDFRFNNPRFLQTVKLWVPYLASASIFAINQFIANFFASGLENGSVSALINAIMFLQIPIGVFTTSITTVVFPRMSRQVAAKDTEGLRGTVSYGIEFLTVLLVPSAVLLCLLGKEVISVTLQRWSFTALNTFMTSRVLTGYAIGLLFMGIYNFLQRFFYSLKEFRTPIVSAVMVAVVDVIFSLWLKGTSLRVTGLAIANSIAFAVGLAYLLFMTRRRLARLGVQGFALSFLKSAAASTPMAVFITLFLHFKGDLWSAGSSWRSIAWVAGAVLVSMILTLAMYALLRVSFVMELLRRRKTP